MWKGLNKLEISEMASQSIDSSHAIHENHISKQKLTLYCKQNKNTFEYFDDNTNEIKYRIDNDLHGDKAAVIYDHKHRKLAYIIRKTTKMSGMAIYEIYKPSHKNVNDLTLFSKIISDTVHARTYCRYIHVTEEGHEITLNTAKNYPGIKFFAGVKSKQEKYVARSIMKKNFLTQLHTGAYDIGEGCDILAILVLINITIPRTVGHNNILMMGNTALMTAA